VERVDLRDLERELAGQLVAVLRDGSSKISLRQTTSISSGLPTIASETSLALRGAV
jgi:hypothetical protein